MIDLVCLGDEKVMLITGRQGGGAVGGDKITTVVSSSLS